MALLSGLDLRQVFLLLAALAGGSGVDWATKQGASQRTDAVASVSTSALVEIAELRARVEYLEAKGRQKRRTREAWDPLSSTPVDTVPQLVVVLDPAPADTMEAKDGN